MDAQARRLFGVILDSWDRNNTVLLNLLRAVPDGGLETRAAADSPAVSEMFTHLHHERMVSVSEEAPECAGPVPEQEWLAEPNRERIAAMLAESAAVVRSAVASRVESGRDLDLHFGHPVRLIQFLIFHEAYHHGQIKLALKAAGCPLPDAEAGPLTWGVWRRRE